MHKRPRLCIWGWLSKPFHSYHYHCASVIGVLEPFGMLVQSNSANVAIEKSHFLPLKVNRILNFWMNSDFHDTREYFEQLVQQFESEKKSKPEMGVRWFYITPDDGPTVYLFNVKVILILFIKFLSEEESGILKVHFVTYL